MRDFLDIPFGYRFVGYWGNTFGNQIPIKEYSDIKGFVEEHLGLDNIGISISTFKDNQPYLLFLPFDFDSKEDIRKAWDDAKRLYNYLVREKYTVHMTISGSKGFHVLVETKPKVYTRKQLKISQKYFKKLLSLNTIDEQIFGDIRRLIRLPWTFNINGGLCKVIASNDGKPIDLDEIYEDEELPMEKFSKSNEQSRFHDFPCVESLIRLDSEPRHMIRFAYAILRLDEGYTIDEILDEIESFGWQDFNPDYTRKQIDHIESRGYVPPSCSTLKELGFCNIENCEYRMKKDDLLKEVGVI